jgi:pimeloyl-ACP methyl ester carboxylesterase
MWREQLAVLADEFDLIAWDAPGYGDSDDPAEQWTIDDYADRAAGLLDALGIARAHVVGQSWGGAIAQSFAGRHGDRLRSLVLANTRSHADQLEAERREGTQARLRALETMTPAEIAHARTPVLLSPNAPDAVRREVEANMATLHPEGYRLAALALGATDARDVLAAIRVPTLVIAGEFDRVVPRPAAEQLAGAIPGARLVVIPGAGHMANQENPDTYDRVLRDFLHGAG